MKTETINVARDFSDTPGGRHKRFGPASGEEFRERLQCVLQNGDRLVIVLDGAEGYGSSFLEEAFGGLIRLGWSLSDLENLLTVEAHDESYQHFVALAWKYMKEASDRLNA